jgi:hypothetical protein
MKAIWQIPVITGQVGKSQSALKPARKYRDLTFSTT